MTDKMRKLLYHIYMGSFLFYLLVPLVIMSGAAFNNNKTPSVYPWKGFSSQWFVELWNDGTMWTSFGNTIWVALAVVAIAVPLGAAGAILINSISGWSRSFLYFFMVAPILAPGAVIGISTILFWNKLSVPVGLHLSVLGQVSYIASFVMLLVLARLQSFDQNLEEAALDLGASHNQVLRRILLPHLYPALGAGAAIAFFQSIENFNVTLFTRGTQNTLTVYVFSKVRSGITPSINALAFLLIAATLVAALIYEVRRRRAAALEAAREAEGRRAAEAEMV
ncbi:ABC transporter permease [Stagnihabitans tardus]|uniref:ABC transporter permease subunit n=1 Tax=Stagnihabitans tardus TaxID=2699202 RepID=A0AAE4Y7W7_9RHOB|nr:ABC transporter permease [Stagnihabitans tardus]NBZ86183.1 ABC transporter permease subunit [Stagnihabitans tardus]